MDDKLKHLKVAANTRESQFQAMLEELRMIARCHKAKYDALIKEGFNESQALELCKKIIW